jgi:hypothetical protein
VHTVTATAEADALGPAAAATNACVKAPDVPALATCESLAVGLMCDKQPGNRESMRSRRDDEAGCLSLESELAGGAGSALSH